MNSKKRNSNNASTEPVGGGNGEFAWFKEYLRLHAESMTKISVGIEASGRAIENLSEAIKSMLDRMGK